MLVCACACNVCAHTQSIRTVTIQPKAQFACPSVQGSIPDSKVLRALFAFLQQYLDVLLRAGLCPARWRHCDAAESQPLGASLCRAEEGTASHYANEVCKGTWKGEVGGSLRPSGLDKLL